MHRYLDVNYGNQDRGKYSFNSIWREESQSRIRLDSVLLRFHSFWVPQASRSLCFWMGLAWTKWFLFRLAQMSHGTFMPFQRCITVASRSRHQKVGKRYEVHLDHMGNASCTVAIFVLWECNINKINQYLFNHIKFWSTILVSENSNMIRFN